MADEITNATIARDAIDLLKSLKRGEIDESQLNDRGQMLLALARKQVKLADLNLDGKELLGLPLSTLEQIRSGASKGWTEPPATSEGPEQSKPLLQRLMGNLAGAARMGHEAAIDVAGMPTSELPGTKLLAETVLPKAQESDPEVAKWLKGLPTRFVGQVERAIMMPATAGLKIISSLPGYDSKMEDFWLPIFAMYGGRNRPRRALAKEAADAALARGPELNELKNLRPEIEPEPLNEGNLRTGGPSQYSAAWKNRTGQSWPLGEERALPPGPPNSERVPPAGRTRSMLPPGQETRALPESTPASRQTVDADEYRRVIRGAGDRSLPPGPPEPGRPGELPPHVNFERLTPADEPIAPLRGSETPELPPHINYERVPPEPPPAAGQTVDAESARVLEGDELRRALRGQANAPPPVPEQFQREEVRPSPPVPPGQRELPPHIDWRRPPPGEPVAPDVGPPPKGEPFNLPPPPERQPQVMYHGTNKAFADFDAGRSDPKSLYGPGYYFTESPEVAGGYAGKSLSPNAPIQQWHQDVTYWEKQGVPEMADKYRRLIAQATSDTPNIRPALVDVKNPFDIDAAPPPGLVADLDRHLMGTLSKYHPELTTNEQVYRALTKELGDKAAVNDLLRKIGYDGITHIGGKNTGTPPHRVVIAFDSGQVRPAFGVESAKPPVFDRLQGGLDQGLIPGAERSKQPTASGPLRAKGPQEDLSVNPLLNPEGAARAEALDRAQMGIGDVPPQAAGKPADLVGAEMRLRQQANVQEWLVDQIGGPRSLLVTRAPSIEKVPPAVVKKLREVGIDPGDAWHVMRDNPPPEVLDRLAAQAAGVRAIEPPPGAPEPPAKVKRVNPGAFQSKREFAGGVPNLADPDDVYAIVKGAGGIKVGDFLRGEHRDIPAWSKNNKSGILIDRLAAQLEESYGIPRQQAAEQILETLRNYGTLKAAKAKGAGPKLSKPPEWSGMSQAEWDAASPREREFFEQENARGGKGAARVGTLAALGAGTAGALAAAPSVGLPGSAATTPGGDTGPTSPLNAQDILTGLGGLAGIGAMMGGLRGGKLPPEAQARVMERIQRGPAREWVGRPPQGMTPPGERVAGRVEPPPVTPPPGVPPTPPGPTEPAQPSPYRGIPMEHLDGRSIWGGVKELTGMGAATMVGRLEAMGPAGREIARLYNRTIQQGHEWFGLNVQPVVTELSGLTKAEKANFWDVLETPNAQPVNEKVAAAVDRWDVLFGTPERQGVIPAGADQRNILVKVYDTEGDPSSRAFQPRFGPNGHYAPHEFDPQYVREVLKPNSRARKMAIEGLVERSGLDPETAAITLDNYFGASKTRVGNRIIDLSPERRVGGLENAREMNLDGYLRDPEVVAAIRGAKVARRFAEIDNYGPADKVIGHVGGSPDPDTKQARPPAGLIGDIHMTSGANDAATAEALFHYFTGGQHPWQSSMGALARAATNMETFTKLPLAFLNDLANPALLATRTNTLTMVRSLVKTMMHPADGPRQIRDMGILSNETLRDFYASIAADGAFSAEGSLPQSVMERGAQWGLRAATKPWNMSLRLQEMMMANAGGIWADRLNGMLGQQRNARQTAWLGRELDRLNFSKDEIRNRMETGQLTPEDIRRIKWEIVDQTLYISGTGRQSEFMKNPLGRMAEQFKFWTINTGRMLKQNVLEEMKHGNMAPAARMAILFPVFGELYQDAKAAARGTERPGDLGERLMDDFFAAGGLALVTDFVQQVQQRGKAGVAYWLAGPAASDVADLSNQAYQLTTAALGRDSEKLRKEMHATGRFLTKQVPFFGPWMSAQMRDDPKAAERARRTWDERLGLDPWTNALRDAELLERKGKAVQKHAHELAAQGKIDDAQAILESFNTQHGTHFALNPAAIMRRRELGIIQADPRGEAAMRTKRLSPGVQGILQQGIAAGQYAPPGGR